MTRRLIRLFAAASAIALSPLVIAQPAGASGDDFIHRIQPGDTLSKLSSLYTRNSANWATLQRHNTISDPQRLNIGFPLRIPFTLIPEIMAPTTAIHVQGQAEVDGAPLATGMPLTEGMTITTSADGFVTLQLSDGTKLTLPRGGSAQLERLRQFEGIGLTDSIVRIDKGEVESDVAPTGQGVGRFEIRTPQAVMGVRGTRFRVSASEQGSRSEILEGRVDLRPHSGPHSAGQPVSLDAGYGAAISPDGTLVVQALLPAPQLGPAQRTGAGQWTAQVTPVAGAVAYLVQVSRDAEGLKPVSSQQFNDVNIRFSARRPGTHYVSVRAVDAAGLGGRDAYLAFEGASVLMSDSGQPLMLSDGSAVTLADY